MALTLEPRNPPITDNIPSWVDSRQEAIILTCAITPVFTLLFVSLRLYARKFITKTVGWDDWIAGFTLVLCILYSILLSFWARNGGGMHQHDLEKLGMLDEYYFWIEVSSPVYALACLGYKVSILLLYLRVFSLQKWTIYATWFTLILTSGYLVANFFVQLTGCTPIDKFWQSDLPGHCINFVSADIALGSLNVITDFLIFILPMPAVWQSRLSLGDKLGATVVFFTGCVAFVASLVRFQYAIRDLTAHDRTYLAGLSFIWMVLEINTGLICSCGPAMKPLYRKFFNPEKLERVAPAPVRYAINTVRNKRRSIWDVSDATLTANSTEGTGKPKFMAPWDGGVQGQAGQEWQDIELQDAGGILSKSESQTPEAGRPFRAERLGSDPSTEVGMDEHHIAVARQQSFV